MAISSGDAERMTQVILSFNNEILSVSIIDKAGNILATKSRVSFLQQPEIGGLERAEYENGGTLAIASLTIANEIKHIVGETQAIITVHKYCKLMLLPMVSYGILVGLALERSAVAENDILVDKIERLVAHTLELE